ncbi:efflux RND transporter permease subunit [Alginatibacterium sediminis]|uniref:Efflux RND transporter permease subunit n=1 Tax=Alginatibacterium sediminis TaxID=2164068 RepID=A0A420E8M2_9ALTE|nr:efflux RND transporter permease subunit [Alginatibacterium sediminis]RKF15703.1 efflux RND transporter permease subunit [Alginatibacterium sediminis]
MIRYFTSHPTLANLIMIAFIFLGLSSIGSIKRETFPDFSVPYVQAQIIYPGASPIEVEESLCLRMEDAVDGLSSIEETRCTALEGSASLLVKLSDDADVGRMMVDVQTEINAINDFPAQIEPPIVREFEWSEPVVDIAINGDASWPDLKAYAEDLKRRLKTEADVSLVRVSGFSTHQLRVSLNEIDLRRLNMSVNDVASQISSQNIKIPSGNVELKGKNLLLRVDQRNITPATLGEMIISSDSSGGVVRLKDIATIEDRFELDESKIIFNGKPAAILNISKNKADDALRIKEQVLSYVEQERLILPQGMSLTLTNDLSSLLKDRLEMMLRNGWQGIMLVFAVMWLFFSFRYSFWVAAGLPVAFLGGLYLMSLFGLSINIMTLIGLLMAIGIMMDDAIVLSESIASHLERGMSIDDAVSNGVKKVAPGVISSFLTTVFIFGSLLWLDGQMGAVLRVVPLVLILVLCFSLIEAFLILPSHLSHSLHRNREEKQPIYIKLKVLEAFEVVRNVYLVNGVERVVRWRYLSIGATFSLLLCAIALVASGTLKFVGFPELDGDIAEARIILPPGSSLAQTEVVVAKLVASAKVVGERLDEKNAEPEPLVRDITEQFNFNADAGESGPHVATVRLDLSSAETRRTLIDDLINEWRSETGELAQPLSLVFKQPAMGPSGRAIEVRLQHPDLGLLKQASIDLQLQLNALSGVSGVLDDMRPGKEEIVLKLRPGAESYGVDGNMIASQLRAAFYGQTADEIQVGPENIEIDVRLDKEQAGDLSRFENFPIMLKDGNQVPLIAVAELSSERGYVRIQRINAIRTATVMADVDNRIGNSTEINARVRNEFIPALAQKYPGLKADFEGEAKENAKTAASFVKSFSIGLFGLFAILSFQFRSYIEPVVVMLAIPLALIGVLFGHFLLGYPLSMPSILGFVSLAGIVVNDSILLVQYIRYHVSLGDSVHDAVVSASRERFRAVFLTSLTTAAGLLPLMLETSLQAQVVKPIVISIVFGIFASTLLVLFIIPAAYAALADFKLVHYHRDLNVAEED